MLPAPRSVLRALEFHLGPLWCGTLRDSGWHTHTYFSVVNLLHKCVTSQWEVTCTVVYVPQAKMSNPCPHNTDNYETKREEGRKYMCHRMRMRMKPR